MTTPQERYAKQLNFIGLGPSGQARLAAAAVLVCGAGGLGGTLAQLMVRAGVGRVRVVDRDLVEPSNLNRQLLFDEDDLGRAKAEVAASKLAAMNRAVRVEGLVAEVNPASITGLMAGVDLILDGLDNLTARYAINDAAIIQQKPWVFAGCVAARGSVMFIDPGRTPCLRCLFPHPPAEGDYPNSDSAGILGPAASATASLAAAEALKHLSGNPQAITPGLTTLDLWTGRFRHSAGPQSPAVGCMCGGGKV